MGLHTAIETSGFLGDRVDDDYLGSLDLVLLDIKSWDPETYRKVTGQDLGADLALRRATGCDRQAGVGPLRAGAGPDRRPGECRRIARFVAPMKNVEWVEVLPFHQMGAFKWKALGLDYKLADTAGPPPDLVARVIGQFRAAGCNAR